jgi:polyisoprenoid-binding protein YceI
VPCASGYSEGKLGLEPIGSEGVSTNGWSGIVHFTAPPIWNGFRPGSKRHYKTLAVCLATLAAVSASAQQRAIDAAKSEMTVRVYKAGVFSAFGHDHQIAAPVAGGAVDTKAGKVELRAKASALQVRDPGVSEKDRAEIQSTMLGPQVLDAERYPEIMFRSTGTQAAGAGSWSVQGNLTLHGQTRPVTVEVRETGGRYVGTARFKQTDFGIKPVKVGGGAIRVKDEIRIEFDIQLAP